MLSYEGHPAPSFEINWTCNSTATAYFTVCSCKLQMPSRMARLTTMWTLVSSEASLSNPNQSAPVRNKGHAVNSCWATLPRAGAAVVASNKDVARRVSTASCRLVATQSGIVLSARALVMARLPDMSNVGILLIFNTMAPATDSVNLAAPVEPSRAAISADALAISCTMSAADAMSTATPADSHEACWLMRGTQVQHSEPATGKQRSNKHTHGSNTLIQTWVGTHNEANAVCLGTCVLHINCIIYMCTCIYRVYVLHVKLIICIKCRADFNQLI